MAIEEDRNGGRPTEMKKKNGAHPMEASRNDGLPAEGNEGKERGRREALEIENQEHEHGRVENCGRGEWERIRAARSEKDEGG